MHLKVSRHLKERYQHGICPPWSVMQHSTRRTTHFAQHYPAAVEAIYPLFCECTDEGVPVCRSDSFVQHLASPKHPTHFQWGLELENTLAIRDVEYPCCLRQSRTASVR
ncbi:hypothetical protein TNCV_4300581 [Trichonephila clavipes]|nr:hypothetical protein TNCV_4300581 [Trichonephila clavipes]